MTSDLRLGHRLLWKDKAFSLTAGLTLAICIGANTALFSVVHNVLLRPLPGRDSDRIVLMSNLYPKAAPGLSGYSAGPDYADRVTSVTALDDQAMYAPRTRTIDQNGSPTRVEAMAVTPSFFRLVRVSPVVGRVFTDAEGEAGNDTRVILSDALWQSAFGGDTQVTGKTLRLDGRPFTVVGVMPREFMFVDPKVRLWVPLAFTAQEKTQRHSNNWFNVGRLKSGTTIEQVQAQLDALNAANMDRFPEWKDLLINAGFSSMAMPLQDFLVRDVKPTLYLLWGGALFVLLIGAVNVINLALVRSRLRRRELATKLAIGASRWRVARQLIVESVLLTTVAAALGILLGYAALQGMRTLNLADLPRANEIRIDGMVILATLAVSVVIGSMLGLIPIASAIPSQLTSALREEGRSGTSGRGARNVRRGLVVAQVAFAFVLLVGAGLLLASFRRILAIDPGFRTEGVLTSGVSLPRSRYRDLPSLAVFHNEALRRLRALPGVVAAGATSWIPLSGDHNDGVILAEGYEMRPGESLISPRSVDVTPGYFEAMGATLVRGRFFDARDASGSPFTIIVDETLARHFWRDQDPIGRRMYRPDSVKDVFTITATTRLFTVVGVIRDIKLDELTEEGKTVGAYYFPMDQDPTRGIGFAIKTAGDPASLGASVRSTLNALDRELPVLETRPMADTVARALAGRRSPVVLALAFAGLALLLSAIGIYGVLAYLVAQRRREIGIRIALGSSAPAVFRLVLREGALLIASGFVVGLVGSVAVRRVVQTQLYGITAGDPIVLTIVTVTLAIVALIACALPARRATRIDPVIVLSE